MSAAPPDTIVLVHGFWVTPRSWEHWVRRYEEKGFTVLAPAYPGFEVEVEALNADPTPIEAVTLPGIVDAFAAVIEGLERPPLIIGHSAGGLISQMLVVERGLGAAGVIIGSVPPEGVLTAPLSQLRSVFPVLRNPANRHRAAGFTPEQFRYAFCNTMSEDASRAVYDRYHIPANGRLVFDGVVNNFLPGPHDTHVDTREDARAPLLLIALGEDHIMPPKVQRAIFKHYARSAAVTEIEEVPDFPHFPGADGWEAIADRALEWGITQGAHYLARRRASA